MTDQDLICALHRMAETECTFGRTELARILDAPVATVNSHIQRDLIPTLIGKQKKAQINAFDALMAVVADMFSREGGLDRTAVARVLHGSLKNFRDAAVALDAEVEEVTAFIVFTVDGKLGCFVGPFNEMLPELLKVRPHVIRTSFVSLNIAANLVRVNAKQQGIDIGDKFGVRSVQ